jgi:hypothetical protein
MVRFIAFCSALFTALSCYSQRVVIEPSAVAGIHPMGLRSPASHQLFNSIISRQKERHFS